MKSSTRVVFAGLVGLALVAPAFSLTPVVKPNELDSLMVSASNYWQNRQVAPFSAVEGSLANQPAWKAVAAEGELYFDVRTGEPALVKGTPVPFVPGKGNDLTLETLAARLGTPVTVVDEDLLARLAGRFLDERAELLGVPRHELALRGVDRVNDHLWVVTFLHQPSGIPVAGSRLTLVIGHGNLILWGMENIFPRTAAEPSLATVAVDQASALVEGYVRWDPRRDALLAAPELVYLPQPAGHGALVRDVPGKSHRLVWEMIFRRQGMRGTWLAHVDAASGEIVQFGDTNRYASIRGGIYPSTWTDPEESRALPLVGIGGGLFSSLEGQYNFTGTPVTGSLDGELTRIQDQCPPSPGFPSVDSDLAGDIDFGTGPPNPAGDADCTNNGVGNNGGDHNTHAARSAFYHITRLKDKGRKWLPANTWLDSSHDVRVNINDVCNAYWSPGGGFNGFFQEGFYSTLHCFNTGEIAAIFLHEVGHGMDQNDVQGSADGGTGETYADVIGLIDRHDSCMGPGFWTQQCTGYGFPCTDCSGVRDQDYAKHVDGGGNPVTTPFTPSNFTSFCPGGFFGSGPCGQEVHCEAYPAGGAVWDLAVRKLTTSFELQSAWRIVERDFYLSTSISTAMFNCNSTTFASDGCAATSWFQAMLAADDDDGNLANGTPHAAAIFEAFDDHAIACGAAGDAANQNSGTCPSLATPSLAANTVGGGINLSWGAVAGAGGYAVLKNHGECNLSYNLAATVVGGMTTYLDTDVDPNQPYSYRVVALGGAGAPDANACYSEMSNCATPGGDLIFTDGFESGDTSAWSSVNP